MIAKAPRGLTGNRVQLSKVSVGATHNALMAAVLARGETLIEGAAREPEVVDLGNCLIRMGRGSRVSALPRYGFRDARRCIAPSIRPSRSHRDRHLCHGRCHDRRRRDARWRPR